jgi:hypothetical protein
MSDTVQPGRERHSLPPVRRDRLYGMEKDLLRHVLCLCPIAYFENQVPINLIEVLFI